MYGSLTKALIGQPYRGIHMKTLFIPFIRAAAGIGLAASALIVAASGAYVLQSGLFELQELGEGIFGLFVTRDDTVQVDLTNNAATLRGPETDAEVMPELIFDDDAEIAVLLVEFNGTGDSQLIFDPTYGEFTSFLPSEETMNAGIVPAFRNADAHNLLAIGSFLDNFPIMVLESPAGTLTLAIAPEALAQIGSMQSTGILLSADEAALAGFTDEAVTAIYLFDPATGAVIDAESVVPGTGSPRNAGPALVELSGAVNEIEAALAAVAEEQGLLADEDGARSYDFVDDLLESVSSATD
jgi:hypothetical protein